MFYKKKFHLFILHHYFPIQVKMSWNIGGNRNLFLKLKSKLGLYHVVVTTPKTSPEKLTLTVVEKQQLPDIEKTDSKEEISCLKWTKYNGSGRYVWTFRLIQTSWILSCSVTETIYEDNEVDLKLTEYQSLLAKRVYLLSYIEIFYKRCIVLHETTFHN